MNRQHKATSILTATHKRLLKVLDKEIESINKLLTKAVSEVTEWQRTYEILNSVPGVGDVVPLRCWESYLSWVSYRHAK
ncbi:hypothetical protein [Cellvibrio sp. PSBB023]|uniref:hypothetical protein n=1 Tax=Cellvibrio sp. PSBB023 TaxID=1945512 RepID=UPI00122DF63D|nr:hypothetical protein [Cellvibrio sp. PSBB023]